jgi:polysaccharide export outer membrane protein
MSGLNKNRKSRFGFTETKQEKFIMVLRRLLLGLAGVMWLVFLLQGAETEPLAPSSNAGISQNTSTNLTTPVYKLAPNDLVEVKVYLEPDLDAKGVVDEFGCINLPLLGSVKIAGKTPTEAANYIKSLYEKDYLTQANVNLTVVEFAKRQFTVLGQVQKPGVFEYPVLRPVTILEAIGLAGGFTRVANQSNVTVQRYENGIVRIFKVDVKQMLNNPKVQPFLILPDDVITVGESAF